jgi:flagellar brake protein
MEQATYLQSEEQFLVHNQKEIVHILNELAKHHVMLKLTFNQKTCLTNVISVDTRENVVYLDIGVDEVFNDKLLTSHHITFSKDDGVKIKWISEQLTFANLKDGKAIKINIPTTLMRLQRREFFRLATPIASAVPCLIPVEDDSNIDEVRFIELTLIDASLGGVAAMASHPLDQQLIIGANFDKCRINFPDVGETSVTLQVRNINQITLKDGVVKYRIGLQYISPSRGNEGLIHRYTYNLERQAMALASKM